MVDTEVEFRHGSKSMTNAALRGKPDAGNPHVRFDEGEDASAATPRRGSLLYKLCKVHLSAVTAGMLCLLCLASPAYAASLKFLTFNIWGDYFKNPVSEREAGVEAAILKDIPDIVSLQEVTPNWYRSPMFANLGKAGYVLVRGDEDAALKRAAFSGQKTDRHINHEPLLYRRETLTLLDSGVDFFHLTLQPEKSVTWAVLEEKASGRRFVAFATHFWWRSNGVESDTIRELNARHILLLLADIRRKWGAELPAVLGGDLNSRVDSIAHGMLRSGGFVNAASNADVRSPHCSHHGNPKRGEDGKYHGSLRPREDDTPERSIDHVYYTKGIHALRHEIGIDQAVLDVSDHSPVIVEFEFETPKLEVGTSPMPCAANQARRNAQ